MPAEAGIQWRLKHAICWLVPDSGQARNDEIHEPAYRRAAAFTTL
jgi:hypothetical protein